MITVAKGKLIVALVLSVIIAFFVYYFWYSEKGLDPNTIVVSIDRMPDVLNPVLSRNAQALIISRPVFGGITKPSGEKVSDFSLDVASEINQREDEKNVYDIVMRQGVKWHDGRDLTARDILYTYQCLKEPDNKSPLRGYINELIRDITVQDELHLTIEFVTPIAPGDALWVLDFGLIPSVFRNKSMPINLLRSSIGMDFSKEPVGLGPYQVESIGNNQVKLRRATNDALVENVVFQLQYDVAIRVKKLIDQKVDLLLDVDPQYFEELKKAGIQYCDYLPFAFYAVAYNLQRYPFSDAVFRRALNASLDKRKVARDALSGENGDNYVNYGPFPHNAHRLFRQFKEVFPYDPSKAKDLLARSSYRGERLELIYPSSYGSMGERIARSVADMFRRLGIAVEVIELGRNFFSKLESRDYSMAVVYETGFNRQYNIVPLFHSQGARNITGLRDGKTDELLLSWENTVIMDEKYPLSKELHQRISEVVPYTFLFTLPKRAYFSRRLKEVNIVDADAILGSISKWRIDVEAH